MSNYNISSSEEYNRIYSESINNPEKFWNDLAIDNFTWIKPWNKVLDWDFKKPEVKWFEGCLLYTSPSPRD